MQKSSAILLTSLALVAVLCAALLPCALAGVAKGENVALAADYYAPITATYGKELLGQIHDLITDTHTKYTTYDDCKDPSKVKQADPGSSSGLVREFYSNADIDGAWGKGAQGTWNREHVWCQSLSNNLWGESGGGSDLHHLRPVESGLNSARGNNKFGTVANRDNHKVYYEDNRNNPVALGGYNNGGIFEPIDPVKGDVARIVLYVYVHYNSYTSSVFDGHATTNGSRQSNSFGNLPIRNIMGTTTDEKAFELLMQWNEQDKVDDVEIQRNNYVYSLQGNRNPFIDHPEYINAIWGDTPIGETPTITLDKDSVVLRVGETATITATTNSAITPKWEIANNSVATIAESGNSCTITAVSKGETKISVSVGGQTATCTVTVVEGSTEEFTQLVHRLPNCETLEEKFNVIKAALAVYKLLSDSGQAQVDADYQTLQQAIASYNTAAESFNDSMTDAMTAAIAAMAPFFVALAAVYNLIVRKLV